MHLKLSNVIICFLYGCTDLNNLLFVLFYFRKYINLFFHHIEEKQQDRNIEQ